MVLHLRVRLKFTAQSCFYEISWGAHSLCLLGGLHLLVVQGHVSESRILTACDLGRHVLNRKTHPERAS